MTYSKQSLSLLFSLFFVSLFAQKPNNSLLWKISGNGLSKPSYLYGTMHLTDERLFVLSDSLYAAIEQCDGFALEVDPQEMSTYLVDDIGQKISEKILVKEYLEEEKYKKYSALLSKKLGKPADEITTEDIFREKNKWVKESYKKGSMRTFLDAYLCDIARKQGKWIGGLEKMADQKNLVNTLIDESDIVEITQNTEDADNQDALETFIQVYLSQDLDKIEQFMQLNQNHLDDLLLKRNRKMVLEIMRLSNTRSMVYAVGAAHLPGIDGLIDLLRKNKYQVEPVFSKKTIKPSAYKIKVVEIPWVKVTDTNERLEVEMPGKPGVIDLLGLSEMNVYIDIFNGTSYLAAGINVPYDQHTIDSIKADYPKSLFKKTKINKPEKIYLNGITGEKYTYDEDDAYKVAIILNRKSTIYIAVGIASKNDEANKKAIERFIKSLKILDVKVVNGTFMVTHLDSTSWFKLEVPSKPKILPMDDTGEPSEEVTINTEMYLCNDFQTGAYFFFGTNSSKPGYAITDDQEAIQLIREEIADKFLRVDVDSTYEWQGYPVLEYSGLSNTMGLYMKARYILRGNFWNPLVALYDHKKPQPTVDNFFKSYQTLDFPETNWKVESDPEGIFKTWAPSAFTSIKPADDPDIDLKMNSHDAPRHDSYDVMAEHFSPYYWQPSDSAFWAEIKSNLTDFTDTILSVTKVKRGDYQGIDLLMQKIGSSQITHRRMYLYGNQLFTVHAILPKEYAYSANSLRFFDDFQFLKPAPKTTIFDSKAVLLVQDLFHPDSATRAQAREIFPTVTFTEAEYSLLHEALIKAPIAADSVFYQSINEMVFERIRENQYPATLDFAKKEYGKTKDPLIKKLLFRLISHFKTGKNYEYVKQLLLNDPPPVPEVDFWLVHSLLDSTLLTKTLFPDIWQLLPSKEWGGNVMYLANELLDSNLIQLNLSPANQADALKYAQFKYDEMKQNPDFLDLTFFACVSFLGHMNTGPSNDMLKKMLDLNNDGINIEILSALLKNDQEVPKARIESIAAQKEYRIQVYNMLAERDKLKLFPQKELRQVNFGESLVYDYCMDDGPYPSAINYLSSEVFDFKGGKYRFYFYTVVSDSDDDSFTYLAMAGPYNTKTNDMSIDWAVGLLAYETEFDESTLKEQQAAMISEMEDWYEFPKK
jgi:uncharacterized protein YbaP (TraB family)